MEFIPISSQKGYKNKNKFKVSSIAKKNLLWLPSSYTLNDNDVIKVCNLIKNL